MATLKELAATAKIVTQTALEKSLIELKGYIDAQDTAGSSSAAAAIKAVDDKLNALIGGETGDVDKVINTFNEIKTFLADYSEDDSLKSIIDAVNSSIATAQSELEGLINTEKSRAEAAEGALSARIQTIEDVDVMSAEEAKEIFDSVFNPE